MEVAMIKKSGPSEPALITAALDTLTTLDIIFPSSGEGKTKAKPQMMFDYATNPNYQPDDEFLQLLGSDQNIQNDFTIMLQNISHQFMPRVAAASTGSIDIREIDGFKLKFLQSKAQAEQIYIVIEMQETDDPPGMLFIKEPKGSIKRIALPKFSNGRVQLLFDVRDPDLIALRNINSEVFII